MHSITLVDATDLASWANRRDAQDLLPRLLRRLVHATVDQIVGISLPAGEGVQLGGWDGIVTVNEGNAFVADGTSAWELGTNRGIKGKADEDYEKRCKNPRGVEPGESTFVFVTPRRWGAKADWIAPRKTEGMWREIRAYDADDLESWLEQAPAVHIWLSIVLGKHPENAQDLGTFWADWSETTRPSTSAELLLAGRREAVKQLHGWLLDPAMPLALQADSPEEAVAVFAAAVQVLTTEDRVAHLSRAVVVRDLPAWHRLTASENPLVLIPLFDSGQAIVRATRAGHRVMVPLGRGDSASASTVVVPRLSAEEAGKALVAAGVAEDQARDLATVARRSLMAFRRKLAVRPEVQQPQWARPGEGRSLLAPMLAGAWNDATEGDRQALAALAQAPYREVTETVVRWSNEADPPVRRVADSWYTASHEDMWLLLARYLTRDDLHRFEAVVLDVLGVPDVRFDLPASERWMARARGQRPEHSERFREGLAETLAMIGSRGDGLAVSAGVSVSDYAARAVRRLLEKANGDWRVWASLSHVLPLLAEAAPAVFLAAVEAGLGGEDAPLLKLFVEESNFLFSSSPHVGLLFALETLAWSSEHLGHVALLLAKVSRLEPGGYLSNRPANKSSRHLSPVASANDRRAGAEASGVGLVARARARGQLAVASRAPSSAFWRGRQHRGAALARLGIRPTSGRDSRRVRQERP